MKDFKTNSYCYDHKSVKENVESDSDSDEFHIKIKENVVEEGEDSMVAPRAKKKKVTIAYNSDDSDEEKEKAPKKLPLKMTVMTPS